MHPEQMFRMQTCKQCHHDRFALGYMDLKNNIRDECYVCQISSRVVDKREDLNICNIPERLREEIKSAAKSKLQRYVSTAKDKYPHLNPIPTGLYDEGILLRVIDYQLNMKQSQAYQLLTRGESGATSPAMSTEQEGQTGIQSTNHGKSKGVPGKPQSNTTGKREDSQPLRRCIRCYDEVFSKDKLVYYITSERSIDLAKTCIQCRLEPHIQKYITNEWNDFTDGSNQESLVSKVMQENVDPYLLKWLESGVKEKPKGYFGPGMGLKEIAETYEIVRKDAILEAERQVEDWFQQQQYLVEERRKTDSLKRKRTERAESAQEESKTEKCKKIRVRLTKTEKPTHKENNTESKARSEAVSPAQSNLETSQKPSDKGTTNRNVRKILCEVRRKAKDLHMFYERLEAFQSTASSKFSARITLTEEGMEDILAAEEKLDGLLASIGN